MSIHSFLNQQATIERATPTVDSAGDVSLNWNQIASGVPCRIEVLRVDTEIEDAGEATSTRARGYFPAGTDLRPAAGNAGADRVTVDAVSYLVKGVTTMAGPRGRLLLAALERLG